MGRSHLTRAHCGSSEGDFNLETTLGIGSQPSPPVAAESTTKDIFPLAFSAFDQPVELLIHTRICHSRWTCWLLLWRLELPEILLNTPMDLIMGKRINLAPYDHQSKAMLL